MSAHDKNIEDELVNSRENKTFLMKLIEENLYLRKKKLLRSNRNKQLYEEFISSDDDCSDSETTEASADIEPSIKRRKKDNNNNTIESLSLCSNMSIHSALKTMSDQINILSKSTAELDLAMEIHREIPFVSMQSAYSSSDPVPSYIGDDDVYTISDGKKSVNVPAKNADEVNDLNEILKNDEAFKRAVRNNYL